MNLIDLYDSLEIPKDVNEISFNAIQIPEQPNSRVAVNYDGNPVLLLSVSESMNSQLLKNIRLKYLQLQHNVNCKITENGNIRFQNFTVITFTSSNRSLQEYFLRISETLLKALNNKPTRQLVIETLNNFIEVFRSLTDIPTNTVHGLWTELFLIESCKNPSTLLEYWHNLPQEKFDFNSGLEKIEVKSNSNFERIHMFSSEQLNPTIGSKVLIASIFIRQHSHGQNIQQLVQSIVNKMENNIELLEKLDKIISKTLGNSLEQSIHIKYDYEIAKHSLTFYNHKDIKKIEEIHIPTEVSEVRFKSDLSFVKSVLPKDLGGSGILFTSL